MTVPAQRKLDRAEAELLFQAGASFSTIAERLGVSPQAVHRTAQRLGWKRGEGDGSLLAETQTGRRILSPVTPADFRVASEGSRTLPKMRTILDSISAGATRTVAAGLAGVPDQTFRDWLKDDLPFATMVRQAEATKTWRRIEHLEKASERGDVTATKMLLERDPASRDEWGTKQEQQTGDGPALVINLVLPGGASQSLAVGADAAPLGITVTPPPAASPAQIIDHLESE